MSWNQLRLRRWIWSDFTRQCVAYKRPSPLKPQISVEQLEDRYAPAVLTPTTFSDGLGIGSLRDAVIQANTNGQNNAIVLSAGTYNLTRPGRGQTNSSSGGLDLSATGFTEIIQGAGANVTFVNANSIDRVFQIVGNVNVVFRNLTIEGGEATDSGSVGGSNALGGGILNNGGNVVLDHVAVVNNQAVAAGTQTPAPAALGGGIYTSQGILTIVASTIAHNQAKGGPGAPGSPGVYTPSHTVTNAHVVTRYRTETLYNYHYYSGVHTNHGTHTNRSRHYHSNGSGLGSYTTTTSRVPYTSRTYQPYTTRTPYTTKVPYHTTTYTHQHVPATTGPGGAGNNGGRGQGAGLYATGGLMTITNSTIANNVAQGGAGGAGGSGNPNGATGVGGGSSGGGMFLATGVVDLQNDTISGNQADFSNSGDNGTGGGVFSSSTVTAANSIFAGNLAENAQGNPASALAPDFYGAFAVANDNLLGDGTGSNLSPGHPGPNGNIVGSSSGVINAQLGPLVLNGGQTPTMALLTGSPAIGTGTYGGLPNTDQRDDFRSAADMGAYAYNTSTPTPNLPTSSITLPVAGATFNASNWDGVISGTASDNGGGGITEVQVSIREASTLKYWTGSGFASNTEVFVTATGTTSWYVAFSAANFLDTSTYIVHSVATDSANHVESSGATQGFYFNTPLTFTPSSLPTGTVNNSYPAALTPSNGSGGGYSFSENGTLPSGLFFSPNGTFSGTPTQSGTFNIRVTLTDGAGDTTSRTFSLTIDPALTIAPSALPSGTGTKPYQVAFTPGGGSGNGYTFAENGTLPTGLTFTGGTLNGTPSNWGTFPIQITLTDSSNGSTTTNYSLFINSPYAPYSISTTTGTPQSTVVTTTFATTLSATVLNAFNNPVNGAMVTFTASGTGDSGLFAGNLTAVTVATDANGVATAPAFAANTVAGSYIVTATVGGVDTPADFALTNLAGAPALIVARSGNSQQAVVGTPFAIALAVGVTDAYGNPVPGTTVTFTSPDGPGATFAGGASMVIVSADGHGIATAPALTANTTPGSFTVTASIGGGAASASFGLANLVGAPAQLVPTAGSGQAAQSGTSFSSPFQLTVEDAYGNPVGSGISVTFTAPATGPGGTFPGGAVSVTVITDASGVATAPTFTAIGPFGTFNVVASVAGTPAVNFSLTTTPAANAGFDELGAYRPSDGSWSLDSNGQFGFQGGPVPGPSPLADRVVIGFSPAGPKVIPVSGDWAGLGTSEIGDFEAGTWHLDLNNSGTLANGDTFQFGTVGDVPVPGDYFVKGQECLAVWRPFPTLGYGEFLISDQTWLAEGQAGKTIGVAETFIYGAAGDHIVVGDWNGQGLTEVGVYRDAATYIPADARDAVFTLDVANHHTFDSSNSVFVFGIITDKVVIGDWDGSGTSKVGVYRPASALNAPNTAVFSLDQHGDLNFNLDGKVFLYGTPTDEFVTGRWAYTTSSVAGAVNADAAAALLAAPTRNNPTELDAYFARL